MADFNQLGNEMKKFAADAERAASKHVRATALEAVRQLVMGTPVDSGRAAASWFVSIGEPTEKIRDQSGFKASKSEGERSANANKALSIAINDANKEIGSFTLQSGSLWICNNMPYVGRLNDGWSARSPAGFVETAIQTATLKIKSGIDRGVL